MQESLMKLAEGCVDVHCNAHNTRDAKRQFSEIIQAAYEKGIKDGEQKINVDQQTQKPKPPKTQTKAQTTTAPQKPVQPQTAVQPNVKPPVDQNALLENL